MKWVQPSIEWAGIIIDEPVTTATDVLIGLVCLYAYYRLKRDFRPGKLATYLRIFFLSMAFATFWGGIVGHGLQSYLSFAWKLPAWLTSMVSVAFLERSAIEYARRYISKRAGTFFAWINIIELITFIIITFSYMDFFFVELHSTYGILFIVGGFSLFNLSKNKSIASRWFLGGVLLSVLSAVVFTQGWGISQWFNHMDVSHVLMTVAAWTFYRGGRVMLIGQEY